MRKTIITIAALGLLVSSIAPAMADQIPPGMKDLPAHQHPAKPKVKHHSKHRHGSVRKDGNQQMPRGPMMQGGRMMNGGHMMKGGQMPMPSSSQTAAPPKTGGGCC